MIDIALAGRTALITGANHGIGAATAYALAAQGVAVYLTYLRLGAAEQGDDPAVPVEYRTQRASSASDVVDRIRAMGGRAESTEADLADPAAAPVLFDRAEGAFGPVQILINNASGWLANTFRGDHVDRFGRRIGTVDSVSHDRQFAVDARAPALLIAEFARRHIARAATWGRIIGLTSGGAHGFPEEVSYGAAKAAQESYTLSAAGELGRYGITANMVHPPITDTGWITPAVAAEAAATSPVGDVAQADDVAQVIVYLASDQARRVTGQVIHMS